VTIPDSFPGRTCFTSKPVRYIPRVVRKLCDAGFRHKTKAGKRYYVPFFPGDDTNTSFHEITLIIAVIACFLLAAGCTSQGPVSPAYTAPAAAPAASDSAYLATALDRFDDYAGTTFEKSGVPGMAVAIVRDDEVIYLKCFGVKNITTQELVDPSTWFQLASISKSFTATTIAALVGEGNLSWDDPIVAINPGFRLYDPWVTDYVTFRDLLSHRTGLPEYTGDVLQNAFLYNRSEIQERLRYVRPTGEFRIQYAYMNADITAAAEAAARREGVPWEELVVSRVLVPPGMANTSPWFSDFQGCQNRVESYITVNGTILPGSPTDDGPNSAAGGISSTITDMARYVRLQLNEGRIDGIQVIDPAALEETHRPRIIKKSSNTSMEAYGLCREIHAEDGRIRVEHGGDFSEGASTFVSLYPAERMGIVVLTNAFPEGDVLHYAVTRGWDDIYFTGSTSRDWYGEMSERMQAAMQPGASALNPFGQMEPAPAEPSPSRGPAAYAGTYGSDYYGAIRMVPDGSALLMYMDNNPEPLRLVHYDGDTFQDPATQTGVYLTVGAEGKAEEVLVKMFEMPGRDGTFTRRR
jgi:CubicO group peptidase (beta-lactamase class C family)